MWRQACAYSTHRLYRICAKMYDDARIGGNHSSHASFHSRRKHRIMESQESVFRAASVKHCIRGRPPLHRTAAQPHRTGMRHRNVTAPAAVRRGKRAHWLNERDKLNDLKQFNRDQKIRTPRAPALTFEVFPSLKGLSGTEAWGGIFYGSYGYFFDIFPNLAYVLVLAELANFFNSRIAFILHSRIKNSFSGGQST